MEGKEENGRSRSPFSPDPATESCMLRQGVPQSGDGLILSSFQVLEHREEETGKAGAVLDHFLHPFGHADRLGMGVDDDGQWKTSDIEPLDCRINVDHRARSLPEVDSLTPADHTGASFKSNFLHDALSDTCDGQGSKTPRAGKTADGDGVSDDGHEETDVERCQSTSSPGIILLEDKIHQSKEETFEGIQVETPDLVTSHKRGYIEMRPGLADHGFMNDPDARDAWSQELGHAGAESTVSQWQQGVKTKDGSVTNLPEPEAGKSWVFLHADQHQPPWEKPEAESQAHHHNLMPPDTDVVSPSSHWSRQTRDSDEQQQTGEDLTWMADVGSLYPVENSVGNVCKVYPVTPTSSNNIPASSVTTLAELQPFNPCNVQWPAENQVRPTRPAGFRPRPGTMREGAVCRRVPVPCLRAVPSQSFFRYQGPVAGQADIWPQPVPIHSSTPGPRCVEPATAIQPTPMCPTPVTGMRPRAVVPRRSGVAVTPAMTSVMTPVMTPTGDVPKTRPLLDQARMQAHPYLMKESKKTTRDVFPGTSANVHTLKASHIVSWYIDYLIHENEHLTQISRAFSLPVNLFHSDDFYFMESVKKKVHFPSLKFLSWMQQNLPSINVNAVDFHEGRPPVVSMWNQDWFWQNKSRRDIIHDVFFYFQHRRVTCPI